MIEFNPETIKKLRTTLDLSLHRFGARVGISGQAVAFLEAGTVKPNVTTLVKLMNIYGAPPEYFFKERTVSNEINRETISSSVPE